MVIKHRQKSLVIKLMSFLHARMILPEKEVNNYLNLVKGFEGEQKSDTWLEELSKDYLIVHDLLLEYNHSKFQIDTLLIAYEKIYLLDVKNYEGDYCAEGDKWNKLTPKKEIKNPLHQLDRCETLLRALLTNLGYRYPIESYLIFINPEFHLYQTTINPSIIFPTQLNRFLKKLNERPSKSNKRQFNLAEQLISLHTIESPYPYLPAYDYDQLEKGPLCSKCFSIFTEMKGLKLVCGHCGCQEEVESAVVRSVDEFMLLFPDRKITTKGIHEWCHIVKSEKTIRRVLKKNYKRIGSSISSNYVSRKD
ncbi:nuclease-related domain-containing protein [Neobacillus jeddahensis]|uniref:nuclease-related domain-containing protein n=1 Tax=Neobacillus jeddahensis TaxID=1461580 RepID=UPI00058CBCAF|nr:nuclease-related domain-containing protein [Neobacillus jeddahensis]